MLATTLSSDLAQRRDVIENPEAAAVRGRREIVVLNQQVTHRGCGHVQPQRLPMIAIVEGNVNCALSAGKEQTLALGIFTHRIHILIGGNAVDDFGPGLAGVARAVNVRTQIVETQRVDGGVGRLRIEVAGFDDRNLLPRRRAAAA